MANPLLQDKLLVSNLEMVPGRRVRTHLGMVQGSTVRSKHVGRDLLAGLKNIVGGELKGYTELMQEAREEATERMMAQATSIGANAVLPTGGAAKTRTGTWCRLPNARA